MEHLTIEQAIEHLHGMAESLKKMHEKYPDAKYRGVHLSLNWWKLEDARRDGDWVWYWGINWQEIWIDLHFTTEPEEYED